MTIEIMLDESLENIAIKGDHLILKDDNSWEVKKQYTVPDLFAAKDVIEKMLVEQQNGYVSMIIEKSDDAWRVLTKLHDAGYIDAKILLKEQITKVAGCQDITKIFHELIAGFENEGEGNVAPIAKIIDSCTSEGGNVGGRE